MPHADALIPPPPSGAMDKRIVLDAADWLVKLHSHEMNDADHAALQRWCTQSTDHARAWAAANELARTFGAVPAPLGNMTLGRTRNRRAALKTLAVLLAATPAGWMAWQHVSRERYTTTTGEQRSWTLADGSLLQLNSGSTVDIAYDNAQRLLLLRAGEIMVHTAHASTPDPRPFLVKTSEGSVRALGTRFTVRQLENTTQVAVLEHAVEIKTADHQTQRLQAGQTSRFTRTHIEEPSPASTTTSAWTQGALIADGQRLDDFLAELARYRPGILRCDPAVAHLRISGVFQIADTDQALHIVQETLPVTVQSRTRYWVTVTAAGS